MSFGKYGTLNYDYVYTRAVNLGTIGNPDFSGLGYNVLLNRLLQATNHRWYYASRALELLDAALEPGRMIARAESLATVIREDAERDMTKWGWEDMTVFDQGLEDLTTWIANRGGFLDPALAAYRPNYTPRLRLNELQSQNQTTILDPAGDSDPWLEVTAGEPFPLDLSAWRLSNQPAMPLLWPLPAERLAEHGHRLIWTDAEAGEGPDHAPFILSPTGGTVLITWTGGSMPVVADQVNYPAVGVDLAYARIPDAGGPWQIGSPTPAGQNAGGPGGPPLISETMHVPAAPGIQDTVTVTTRVSDPDGISSVVLVVRVNHQADVPGMMFDDGLHGDGGPNDGLYGAKIPPVANGSTVDYYIEAEDLLAGLSRDPADAPSLRYRYVVGYSDPGLRVNEFMAANDTTIVDEFGDHDDWIEIYNGGIASANLSQFYLTDELNDPDKWRLPTMTLPPAGFLLIWADDEPQEGPNHASFRLERSGEEIGLFQRVGMVNVLVDSVFFGYQADDVSRGRLPDGTGEWRSFTDPTPGVSNQGGVGVEPGSAPAAALALWIRARPEGFTVEMSVPEDGQVRLRVYDVAGRLTRSLVDGRIARGRHSIPWEGRNKSSRRVASGVYFFRLEAANRATVARAVLVR
jgi:hypothetical protein